MPLTIRSSLVMLREHSERSAGCLDYTVTDNSSNLQDAQVVCLMQVESEARLLHDCGESERETATIA